MNGGGGISDCRKGRTFLIIHQTLISRCEWLRNDSMASAVDSLKLDGAPEGGDYWAIRSLGEVQRSGAGDQESPEDVKIKVLLSRIGLNHFHKTPDGSSYKFNDEYSFIRDSRMDPYQAWLPGGFFPALKIGTVIQNKSIRTDILPEWEEGEFDVDTATMTHYHLGAGESRHGYPILIPKDRKGFYLPSSLKYFQYFIINTKKEYLLIPCTEIARYYCLRTTHLANILLNGWTVNPNSRYCNDPNNLYDIKTSKYKEFRCNDYSFRKFPFVQMRTGAKIFSDDLYNDIFVALRICYESEFKNEAENVFNSLALCRANDKTPFIKIGLPFHGVSKLRVAYKTIKDGNITKILVHQILACSSGPPFDVNPIVSVDNLGGEPEDNKPKRGAFFRYKNPYFKKPRKKKENDDEQDKDIPYLVNSTVDSATKLDDIIISDEGFPAYKQFMPYIMANKNAKTESKDYPNLFASPDRVSTANATSNKTRVPRIDILATIDEPTPAVNKLPIPRGVELLREYRLKFEDISFETRFIRVTCPGVPFPDDGESSYIPAVVPDYDGTNPSPEAIARWAHLPFEEDGERTQRRRVWVVEFCSPAREYFYLLELEGAIKIDLEKKTIHSEFSILAFWVSSYKQIDEKMILSMFYKISKSRSVHIDFSTGEDSINIHSCNYKHSKLVTDKAKVFLIKLGLPYKIPRKPRISKALLGNELLLAPDQGPAPHPLGPTGGVQR